MEGREGSSEERRENQRSTEKPSGNKVAEVERGTQVLGPSRHSHAWLHPPLLTRAPQLTTVTNTAPAAAPLSLALGVVYGRCSVSIEPGERGAPHEDTVLSNGPQVEDEGGETTGANRVRREFFERHR